jgi:hypothetical protein
MKPKIIEFPLHSKATKSAIPCDRELNVTFSTARPKGLASHFPLFHKNRQDTFSSSVADPEKNTLNENIYEEISE